MQPPRDPGPGLDTIAAVLDSVFAASAYRWETREDPLGPLRRLWGAVGAAIERLQEQNPGAVRVLAWFLVALLLLLLAHAAWVAWRTVRGGSGRELSTIEMPSTAPRDAAWYAGEATRLAQRGEFVAAMQADFLRLVLELDARRAVVFHPSKTPSEYVRDPRLDAHGQQALRELVRALYGYAFARAPLDRDAYERWRASAVAERYASTD